MTLEKIYCILFVFANYFSMPYHLYLKSVDDLANEFGKSKISMLSPEIIIALAHRITSPLAFWMILFRKQRCLRVSLTLYKSFSYFEVPCELVFGAKLKGDLLQGHCWVLYQGKPTIPDPEIRLHKEMVRYGNEAFEKTAV